MTLAIAGSAVALAAFASGITAAELAHPAGTVAAARLADSAARPAGPASDSPAGTATQPGTAAQPGAAGQQEGAGAGPRGRIILTAATGRHLYARRLARRIMRNHFHWRVWHQYRYLSRLWQRESGWNHYAHNPYSGAYGIPQAVPGSKMSSAGPHWRRNCRTQIRWGLRYIRGRYGSPRRAWNHEVSYGWY